jgi:hypothetical protein
MLASAKVSFYKGLRFWLSMLVAFAQAFDLYRCIEDNVLSWLNYTPFQH